jgi:hypothetical protein
MDGAGVVNGGAAAEGAHQDERGALLADDDAEPS